MAAYDRPRPRRRRDPEWDAARIRALRRHLELTQRGFAQEINARQQTVSEWETGRYRPRGPSARLLTLIAEEAGFRYGVGDSAEPGVGPADSPAPQPPREPPSSTDPDSSTDLASDTDPPPDADSGSRR